LLRNPRSLNGILWSGTFTAVLNLILYWKVGKWDEERYNLDNEDNVTAFNVYLFNLKGFGFLLANNISFSSSNAVIM
jgi:hypothetical protein